MSWTNYLAAITLATTGLSGWGAYGYVLDKCYCWDEMNTTLVDKIPTFNPQPVNPKYFYTGVTPRTGNTFSPCTCGDVTRVETVLTINEAWVYNRTYLNSSDTDLLQNITTSIKNALNDSDTGGIVIAVYVKFDSLSNNSIDSSWWVEVVTRGLDPTVNQEITTYLDTETDQLDGNFLLSGVGQIDGTSIAFTVIECSGDPATAILNGKRTWSSYRLAGVQATYSCNTGYFLTSPAKAFSQCDHTSLNWTVLDANVTCVKGCSTDPPKQPFFSLRVWASTDRKEGSKATYMCMDGYRSADGKNGTSTCKNSAWTAVQTTFKCTQILCPKDIPQVPAFAQTTWDKTSRYIGTKMTFSCIPGYTSTVRKTVVVTCFKDGTWDISEPGFKCLNTEEAVRKGIYSGPVDPNAPVDYDYYNAGVFKEKKVESISTVTLFFAVTVPTIIVMGLILMLLLCCTRTDSPLYWCCRGNTKNTSYVSAK